MNHTQQILPAQEWSQLLRQFNDTQADYPKDRSVTDLFEEQARRTPDAVAVVFEDSSLTYRELDEKSNALACRLIASGTVSEITAIYVQPSVEMVIGIIGILKSGSAFLPLDPYHNPRRTENILEDSSCAMMVTQPQLSGDLSFSGRKIVLDIRETDKTSEQNLASRQGELLYVIYTSGSTGKPKGVKIAHRNLVNYFTWFRNNCRIGFGDKLLLSTSYAFDAIYTQFFSALLTGAELHIVSRETYLSPARLIQYIDTRKISFLKFTPTLFGAILAAPEFEKASFNSVRLLMLGGEAIHPADLSRIAATHPHIELMNHFGPTETTIGSIALFIDKQILPGFVKRPVIGRPISNTKCYILGSNLELLPLGSKGELCISGDGVGLGYLGREDLTSEKFIPDPFNKGERMYRTGDLARWLPDGTIEYLGRIDQQLKIRGYRVEPGEIEAQLCAHDAVDRCVVTLKEKEGRSFLVAYYTSKEKPDALGLRSFLSERLPDYMIPSFFIHLAQMPLTANGKIDRKELPNVEISNDENYTAPLGDTEKKLALMWAELLKVPSGKIGNGQSFFELGGDSLSANALILKIREEFKVAVSWPALFSNPTVSHLRVLIDASEKCEEEITGQTTGTRTGLYPATLAQKNFFIGSRFNPSEIFFDIMALYEVEGSIDIERLEAAFQYVIRRHEALRTSFLIEKGKVMQQVKAVFDFHIAAISSGSTDIDEVIKGLKKPFDYGSFLFRVYYIETATKNYLFLDMPHIISDGHSVRQVMSEVVAQYNGSSIGPTAPQFSDFVGWQEAFSTSEDFRKKETYWLEQFAVPAGGLRFRGEGRRDVAANSLIFKLPPPVREALQQRGPAAGTGFNLLLSAYLVLLVRMSGQEEVTVGIPTRFMNRFEFDHIVGLLTNTIAVRCRLSPDMSLLSCVKAVQEAVVNGLQNKEYPLDLLLEKQKSEKKPLPLFNTYLNYERTEPAYRLDKATMTRRPLKIWREKLPLSVDIYDDDGGIFFRLKYQVHRFTEETIHIFFDNYCRVLEMILKNGNATMDDLLIEPCALFDNSDSVNHNH